MRLIDEVGVRSKNQITVPDAALRRLGASVGDRLLIEADENEPGVLHIRAVRRSYAGALPGVYGTPEEARAYVRDERDAWAE